MAMVLEKRGLAMQFGKIKKTKELIIFGLGDFAQIAYEYFTYDSEYKVVGFAVDNKFINTNTFCNLSVLPFEEIETKVNTKNTYIFIAIIYGGMNDIRKEKLEASLAKGFKPASYVSSKSFVWHNVKTGYHNFIFEDNTIQPFVEIGNNNILWSGNHIGHHSKIADNNFISSHVVVSGNCKIGSNNFFGVNSTINNNLKINNYCIIGSGVKLSKDLEKYSIVTDGSGAEIKITNEKLVKKIIG